MVICLIDKINNMKRIFDWIKKTTECIKKDEWEYIIDEWTYVDDYTYMGW